MLQEAYDEPSGACRDYCLEVIREYFDELGAKIWFLNLLLLMQGLFELHQILQYILQVWMPKHHLQLVVDLLLLLYLPKQLVHCIGLVNISKLDS